MIGFFSASNEAGKCFKKDTIYFVSIPDGLKSDDIKDRFASIAQLYANQMDVNKVYLNYGKDEFIVYEYSI